MGFTSKWTAVRADQGARVIAALGLRIADQVPASNTEYVEPHGCFGFTTNTGHYAIWASSRRNVGFINHDPAVSRGGEALFFETHDSSMCVELFHYTDGVQDWGLSYDGMNGVSEPRVFGDPPPAVKEVIDRQRAAQAAETDADHMYEIAPEVGRLLIGFRHDETPYGGDGEEPLYDLLLPAAGGA